MTFKKTYTAVLLLFIVSIFLGVICQPVFAEGVNQSTAGYRIKPLHEKLAELTDADIVNSLNRFSDTSKHWGRTNIGKLTTLGIINGMPNGTFKPDKAVSAAEYITMVVRTLGYTPEREGRYWAQVYIDRAVEDKIINEDEIKDYELPLSREHAAAIAVKALMQLENEPNSNIYNYIRNMIPDYPTVSDEYKQYMLQAYATGLFNGSDGGYFLPADTITRAEATTVMLRLLDSSVRNPMKPPDSEVLKITNIFSGEVYEIYPSDNLEAYKTAMVLNENIKKSKGYSFMNYNPFAQTVSGSFYSNKDGFDGYNISERKIDMGFSIDITNDPSIEFPYLITVYNSKMVNELHTEVISAIFKELYKDDSNIVISLFEKYIKMASDKTSASDETRIISGRKFRIFKIEGEAVFSVWIYNR